MHSPVNVVSIRRAIVGAARTRFDYGRSPITADLYLLGPMRESDDYMILGWTHTPSIGWQWFQFSRMSDFEVIGTIDKVRSDWTPYDPRISTIDTYLPAPPNSR